MTSSPEAWQPRETCWRCTRPARVCWCAHVPHLETRTRVVFLQHPREEFMPIGTARMAAACLSDAELVVGTELDDRPEVQRALADPTRTPILLWPGPGARDLAVEPPAGPVTLFVVDGTWALAKKLVRINPRIAALPRYRLSPEEPSRYRIRAEPRAECLSTIEATMLALGSLEGDPERFRAMLAPFSAMVETQIDHEKQMRSRRSRYARPPKPRALPAALKSGKNLVVIAGEANAWPRQRDPGLPPGPQDELVQWVAIRVDDGATFEAVIAPRRPLSPTTSIYTELTEVELRTGMSFETFAARWRAFVRDDDVLCAWGRYATGLVMDEGGFVPRAFTDLRLAATQWLRDKPGSVEAFCERFDLHPHSIGRARGGRRLGMALAAATRMLAGDP